MACSALFRGSFTSGTRLLTCMTNTVNCDLVVIFAIREALGILVEKIVRSATSAFVDFSFAFVTRMLAILTLIFLFGKDLTLRLTTE